MENPNVSKFMESLSALQNKKRREHEALSKEKDALQMQARKNGICRDTCFYGCATAFENFKTRCFLDGALASCPCEDYRPATSFSNRIRAFNPPPELLEEIMGVWDFYDPADLANLTYEQQEALLRVLNILYDDYRGDVIEED